MKRPARVWILWRQFLSGDFVLCGDGHRNAFVLGEDLRRFLRLLAFGFDVLLESNVDPLPTEQASLDSPGYHL